MEKAPEKSVSFSNNGHKKTNSAGRDHLDVVDGRSDGDHQNAEDPPPDHVMEEVERFVDALSSAEDKSNPPEIPPAAESLPKMVDSMISKFDSKDSSCRFGQNKDEDSAFVDALNRLSKLANKLSAFPSNSPLAHCLNRSSSVLHRAMTFLDDQFRSILNNSKRNNTLNNLLDPKTPKSHKQQSFKDSDCCVTVEPGSNKLEDFPAFSQEAISTMNKITRAMIPAGYEAECCLLYGNLRRQAFQDELTKLGFDNINAEDVQRMQWEPLEEEITMWINIVKHCASTLFAAERKLCDAVFSDFPWLPKRLFGEIAASVVMRSLNFSGAVVLTKRSTEKLFKFLDMYETLRDLVVAIDGSDSGDASQELINEISVAQSRLGEAAVSIFCELENSISCDQGRTPVPSGAVHPLTRYTMNYLEYACEYKDTLEQVFRNHRKMEGDSEQSNSSYEAKNRRGGDDAHDEGAQEMSPFATELMTVMDLLDANLDMKSKLYRDPALRYIFLMNNGRYILQKIKGSSEIYEMIGPAWTRKRSSDMRMYHKNYQRETWSRVLQCMSHEGLQVSGKVAKPVLKERFKCFNALFEEIHKTQSTWVVSDEQLQSELRVSISAVVIPAYRSFLGRFKQHLDASRQADKYIRYQPEDIETLIDELFDGNPASMGRRKT